MNDPEVLSKPLIIVLAANAREEDRRRWVEAERVDFLSKLVKGDEIEQLIRRIGEKIRSRV
ncbi:MAG: hypothetical protein AAFR87_10865 [Bacteroidota bacterium]